MERRTVPRDKTFQVRETLCQELRYVLNFSSWGLHSENRKWESTGIQGGYSVMESKGSVYDSLRHVIL